MAVRRIVGKRFPATIFQSRLGQATGPDVVWSANSGVLVSFRLPVPQSGEGERLNGELHLRWTAGQNLTVQPPISSRPTAIGPVTDRAVTTRPATAVVEEDEPEDRFAKLLASMTVTQRSVLDARIPQKTISNDHAPDRSSQRGSVFVN